MKIAGLDIGTTGAKLTVFESDGTCLGRAYRDYPVSRKVGGHEVDANLIMGSVYEVISEMSQKYDDIAGIGVTSFGETFVLVDEEGNSLMPSMIYTDPRGAQECKQLSANLGEHKICDITGVRPHEMYSIPKLMWVKKHHPEVFSKVKHIFLIEDFVVWHLTHKCQIDYTLATRTMAFNINNCTWSKEIFDAAGIDCSLMSTPVPTGTSAGEVIPEVANSTGLNPRCQIVSVSHDQVSATVGAGAKGADTAIDGSGTVECLTPIFDSMPNKDVMFDGSYCIVPFLKKDTFVTYCTIYSGGALIKWCTDILAQGMSNEDLENAYEGEDPTNLLVLPHFAGACNPYMDTGSKGAILGLTCGTSLAEIYRACLESIAFELRINHEKIIKSGARYSRLIASGGGANSRLWVQIKADVLNMPVTTLQTVDTGTVGSAMITGLAIGVFKNLEEADNCMIKVNETIYPREDMHKKYNEIYERYKNVYKAVRPLV